MKLKRLGGLVCVMAILLQLFGVPVSVHAQSPAPAFPKTPSFWTSWWWQNNNCWKEAQRLGHQVVTWDTLTDGLVFGDGGMCDELDKTIPADARRNLIFELDWGWDIPHTHGNVSDVNNMDESTYYRSFNGSQILDAEKFPNYGETPQERLKTLCGKVAAHGWGGTGLWILAQEDAAHYDAQGFNEAYWRERLEWAKYAGVAYWMIDFGAYANNMDWRRQLTDLGREVYPELVIQQCVNTNPLNEGAGGRASAAYLNDAVYMASHCDSFRTYDHTEQLKIPTLLDRVGEILNAGYTDSDELLCQLSPDEMPYLFAALGLCATIARYDRSNHPNMDEVARMVLWQQLTPGFSVGAYPVQLSDEFLADDWLFRSGDSWAVSAAGSITQRAPAAIARGIELPTVAAEQGDKPYVVASRNPNGAVSVAAFARTHERTHRVVRSAVTLPVGELTGPIGIFGFYQSLTLQFNTPLSGRRVYARDLLAESLTDITDRVSLTGNTLTLTGELIDELGLSAATAGDTSEPGLLLQLGEGSAYAVAPAAQTASKEWEVNNGGFERTIVDTEGASYGGDAAQPVGWTITGDTAAADISNGGYTGSSLRLSSSDSFRTAISQTKRSLPKGQYQASVRLRADNALDSRITLQVSDYGGEPVTACPDTLQDWTTLTLPLFYDITGRLTLRLTVDGAAGAEIFIDDVCLTPIALERDAAITEISVNGKPLADFRFDKHEYAVQVLRGAAEELPVVAVNAASGVNVEIEQVTALPGTAIVTAEGNGSSDTYRIDITETDTLYVADMTWASSTVGNGELQRNRNNTGNPLRLMTDSGIEAFENGIGTHAPSEIELNIEGLGFETFEALVGVDYEVQPQESWSASVCFEVAADGQLLYSSGILRPSDKASSVCLDIAGCKLLTLRVTDGGDHIYNDMADWVNARLRMADHRHEPITDAAVQPTCTQPGLTEGTHCAVCGRVLTAQKELPALGHSFAAPVDNGDDSHSKACTVCHTCITQAHVYHNGVCACGAMAGTVFVSDMEWVSATAGDKTVQRNLNLSGNTLSAMTNDGVKAFSKGIGTHAVSEIVVDLRGGNFARFQALVANDYEAVAGEGWSATVEFEVDLDGTGVYSSGVMRPSDPAKEIDLDISGKQTLILRVTDGGDHIYNDMADWLNARLVPLSHEHTVVTDAAIEPTCTAPGYTQGSHCSVCLEVLVAQQELELLPHDFAAAADLGTPGNHTAICAVCGLYHEERHCFDEDGLCTCGALAQTVYLSDLAWVSAASGDKTPQRNANLSGNPLQIMMPQGVRTFANGIGTHAVSEIVLDLTKGTYARLRALAANDYEAVSGESWSASVEFEVDLDGATVWSSGLMRPSTPAKEIDLDISSGQTLTLRVTDGGDHIYNDLADWVNARLIPVHHYHTPVTDAATAPACTKTGLTEGSHCAECGKVLVQQQTIPALGHSFENGICTVCGAPAVKTCLWSMEAIPEDFFAAGFAESYFPGNVGAVRARGKGYNGSDALGYVYKNIDGANYWGNGIKLLPYAGAGFTGDWASGELLWFWVDSRAFSTQLKLDLWINDCKPAIGTEYYLWDTAGEPVAAGTLPKAWDSADYGRLPLPQSYCGFVGLPLAGFSNLTYEEITSVYLYIECSADSAALPKTLYFDEFWLTAMGQTPDVSPMLIPFNKPVWTMENLPEDLSSSVTTDWGHSELGESVNATAAFQKGCDGTMALGYEYLSVNVTDNGGNILQIALGETLGAQRDWTGGELLWFWVDAGEFKTPLLLSVNLNWTDPAIGTKTFLWDGAGEMTDGGPMPAAWPGNTKDGRVQLCAGYVGWVGIPLSAYPALTTADVNTLILYFEPAQDVSMLPKTAYFDNFWLTDRNNTPCCAHESTEAIAAVQPSCTVNGLTEGLKCADCGLILTAQTKIAAPGHALVTDTAIAATCTEAGLTEGSHCSVCNEILIAQLVTEALGHDWGEGAVTTEPTLTEKGVLTYTCTRCDATRTEEIPIITMPFTDVPEGKWYTAAVADAYASKLMAGTSETTFNPDGNMTRAMLVTVLWRLNGETPAKAANTFTDVPSGQWYTEAVSWAAENKLVSGIGNGKFDPTGNVTREQIAVFVFNYAKYKQLDTGKTADLSSFPDSGKVSSWARDALSWANAEGLIIGATQGGQTVLAPQGNASRAQVASILMRYVSQQKR